MVGYYAECKENDRLRVLNELQMCRALKEYTDVESSIAAVDKSFEEQIRKQIEKYSNSVKEALEEDADDGDDVRLLFYSYRLCSFFTTSLGER